MRVLSSTPENQKISTPPQQGSTSSDMLGKVVLVTGASSGIGLATACELAQQGAHLVLLCRDQTRGQKAVEQVNQAAGNQEAELLLCDLASFASIRAAAQQFLQTHTRLHVLINNAGITTQKRQITVDGYEETFAINHLGHFLLTQLLLPLLKASAPARIINVSSSVHLLGQMNWDDLQSEKKFNHWKAYAHSKLANILFTIELAKRVKADGITVNSLHPGVIYTNLGRNLSKIFQGIFRIMGSSVEKGAQTSVYLASSKEVENVTGLYFVKKKPKKLTLVASNDLDAARLWKISEQLTKLSPSKEIPALNPQIRLAA